MAVRNQGKQAGNTGAGRSNAFPRRKAFTGDVASMWTPEYNPAPITARGKRRREQGKRARKPPAMLIKGMAHRPHTHPNKLGGGSHNFIEGHHKLVALTRDYKAKK